MRHIITVTPRIAEALVSTFRSTLPHITPIGTADPDIFIIGLTTGIVTSKVARSLAHLAGTVFGEPDALGTDEQLFR